VIEETTKTHGITIKSEATTDKKTEKNRRNQNLLSVKTGYVQHTSPQNNKRSAVNNISSLYPTSTALKYWHDELANINEESTRNLYEELKKTKRTQS